MTEDRGQTGEHREPREAAEVPDASARRDGPPARATRTLRIGLTGPIGCGKSTVAGWLAERGAVVVDADRVARQVVEPGEPALAQVVAAFGDGVLQPDGSLDRAAVARVVFGDPDALRRLEAIIRPAVRPRICAGLAAAETDGAPVVVLEAIGLVEGGYAKDCDEVWLVTCPPGEQVVRLRQRGLADEDAARRIATQQAALPGMRRVATRVVDTGGTPAAARLRTDAALAEALAARDARGPRGGRSAGA